MTLSKLPSLETLAVELNIPTLLKLSTNGHTSESVSQMKFDEAEKRGISTEEYMRLKGYFNRRNNSQQLADSAHGAQLNYSAMPPIQPPTYPYGQPMMQNYAHEPQPYQQPYNPMPYQQPTAPPYQLFPVQPMNYMGQTQPTVIVVNSPVSVESIACHVIGGLMTSLLFSPILGLIGCCLGSKRQRGAWLIGSGTGGILHSISYFIIGSAFQSYISYYDDMSRKTFSSSAGYSGYSHNASFYKSMADTSRSVAIAMFVLASILLVACITEIVIGNRLMNSAKQSELQAPQVTMKHAA